MTARLERKKQKETERAKTEYKSDEVARKAAGRSHLGESKAPKNPRIAKYKKKKVERLFVFV